MMISDRYMAPESWNHFIRTHLYPDVSLPSYVINSQSSMDYPPVSAFCKKYSVSLQAILTALFERAVRSYHKGAIDAMPLAAYVPVNTRRSPFALPSHKNSVFYPAICVVMVTVTKQPSLLEDILHCKAQLTAALVTT